jgi:hypothetical protein
LPNNERLAVESVRRIQRNAAVPPGNQLLERWRPA